MSEKMELWLASVGASVMCGGSMFHGPTESTAKIAFRPTQLEGRVDENS